MADDVDLAQNNTERYIASAIHGVTRISSRVPPMEIELLCEDCDDVIPYKRRMAVPWTLLCIDCAERQEREAKGR